MDDERWKELSKNERVEQFYARIINIIAKYPTRDEHQPFEQNGEGDVEGGGRGSGRIGGGQRNGQDDEEPLT